MPARLNLIIPIDASYILRKYNIPHRYLLEGDYAYTDENTVTATLDDALDFDNFMNEIAPHAQDYSWVMFKREHDTLCLGFYDHLIHRCEKSINTFDKSNAQAFFGCDQYNNLKFYLATL